MSLLFLPNGPFLKKENFLTSPRFLPAPSVKEIFLPFLRDPNPTSSKRGVQSLFRTVHCRLIRPSLVEVGTLFPRESLEKIVKCPSFAAVPRFFSAQAGSIAGPYPTAPKERTRRTFATFSLTSLIILGFLPSLGTIFEFSKVGYSFSPLPPRPPPSPYYFTSRCRRSNSR